MCLNVMYQRPIQDLLKKRFEVLQLRFWDMCGNDLEYSLAEWINLKSDLLCEICYLDSFQMKELEVYKSKLDEYVTQIESTYKI